MLKLPRYIHASRSVVGKVIFIQSLELPIQLNFYICIQNQKSRNMLDATEAKTKQFIKRKSNLVKKADQLTRLCHANLTLIIRKNDKYYMYQSIDHDQ